MKWNDRVITDWVICIGIIITVCTVQSVKVLAQRHYGSLTQRNQCVIKLSMNNVTRCFLCVPVITNHMIITQIYTALTMIFLRHRYFTAAYGSGYLCLLMQAPNCIYLVQTCRESNCAFKQRRWTTKICRWPVNGYLSGPSVYKGLLWSYCPAGKGKAIECNLYQIRVHKGLLCTPY